MEATEPKRRSKERLEEAFDEDCLEAEAGKKLAKHRPAQRRPRSDVGAIGESDRGKL